MPNLSLSRKILNASIVLFIASYWIKELFSFPLAGQICKCLRNLVIPILNLIINNSERPGEPIAIRDDNQGNNVNISENANDLANEGNNQEAIPPALANQNVQNQLNEEYH